MFKKALDILSLGDLMIDYLYWVESFPKRGGDVVILDEKVNLGGAAINVAIAARDEGIASGFCGLIGEDYPGRRVEAFLQKRGVDLSCAVKTPTTGYTVIMVEKEGERTMLSRRIAGLDQVNSQILQALQGLKVLLVSGYYLVEAPQAAFALVLSAEAKKQGALVAYDPTPVVSTVPRETRKAMLERADIVLLNQTELMEIGDTGDNAKALEELCAQVKCVAVKQGRWGASLYLREGFPLSEGRVAARGDFFSPARVVEALDSTGAGDAFAAGFLSSMIRGESPQAWLDRGNELASASVTHPGVVTLDLKAAGYGDN